jgi:hypothetical protein
LRGKNEEKIMKIEYNGKGGDGRKILITFIRVTNFASREVKIRYLVVKNWILIKSLQF